jgi:hypothetical protein
MKSFHEMRSFHVKVPGALPVARREKVSTVA